MPESKEFIKLKREIKKWYLGKEVPKKYQIIYGKKYGEKDVERIAFAIAKSKKIKIH